MPRGAVDSSMHYCPRPQLFYYTTEPETNNILLAIDCLIGVRRRKPVTSHGILVPLNVICHGIVKHFTTLFFHYVYMGDVTGMV